MVRHWNLHCQKLLVFWLVTQQKLLFTPLSSSFISNLIISYLQTGNLFCRGGVPMRTRILLWMENKKETCWFLAARSEMQRKHGEQCWWRKSTANIKKHFSCVAGEDFFISYRDVFWSVVEQECLGSFCGVVVNAWDPLNSCPFFNHTYVYRVPSQHQYQWNTAQRAGHTRWLSRCA